jgi:hypothetical protein
VLIRIQSKPKKTAWLLGFFFLFAGLQEKGMSSGIPMHKKISKSRLQELTLDVHLGTQEDLLLTQDTDSERREFFGIYKHTVQHQNLASDEVCITATNHICKAATAKTKTFQNLRAEIEPDNSGRML